MSPTTTLSSFVIPTNRISGSGSWAPTFAGDRLLARVQRSSTAVLEALDASSGRAVTEEHLAALAADLDAVATACLPFMTVAETPVDEAAVPELSGWMEEAHDAFFHIRRAPRSRYQWMHDRARLFGAVCRQLVRGFFDRDTMASVVRFIAYEMEPSPPTTRPSASGTGTGPEAGAGNPTGRSDENDHAPLDVWRRGHHFLATACVAARAGFQDVREAISTHDTDAIRTALAMSTRAVQAVAASYALAGDVSQTTYNGVIRPLMCPPHTAVEMNGSLNLEYRAYYRAWQALSADLRTNREGFGTGRWSHQLIPLVETLFLSVVIEAHAHVTMAWRLVRGSTALHQDSAAAENGVMVLLSHVPRRLAEYREFIGD